MSMAENNTLIWWRSRDAKAALVPKSSRGAVYLSNEFTPIIRASFQDPEAPSRDTKESKT